MKIHKSRLTKITVKLAVVFIILTTHFSVVAKPVILNKQEQLWLKQHPVIRIAPDPAFAPIEWFNLIGDYQGITSSYVHLLEKKLGIKIEIVRATSWKAAMNMVKNKEIDALSALSRTPQRETFLIFSKPYVTLKGGIISNRKLPGVRALSDLKGYQVAVVKGYRWEEELAPMAHEIAINRFSDLQTALLSTNLGVTDATISVIETAQFIQHKEGLVDLIVVSTLPQDINLRFGIRNDWQQLASILNKGLASISTKEKTAIRNTWLQREIVSFQVTRYIERSD